MIRYESPAQKSAKANLAGLERFTPRRASHTQTAANTGDSVTTKKGGTDCSHNVGISHPNRWRSVKSRANRLSEVGACSYADQKALEKRKSTRITAVRFSSSRVRPAKKNR